MVHKRTYRPSAAAPGSRAACPWPWPPSASGGRSRWSGAGRCRRPRPRHLMRSRTIRRLSSECLRGRRGLPFKLGDLDGPRRPDPDICRDGEDLDDLRRKVCRRGRRPDGIGAVVSRLRGCLRCGCASCIRGRDTIAPRKEERRPAARHDCGLRCTPETCRLDVVAGALAVDELDKLVQTRVGLELARDVHVFSVV